MARKYQGSIGFFQTIVGLALCLGHLGSSHAQSGSYGIEANYGQVLAHSAAVSHLGGSNTVGITATYIPQGLMAPSWRKLWGQPNAGLQLGFINFGRPGVLGSAWFTRVFVQPKMYERGRLSLNYRAGVGLGYMTRTYDGYENPSNLMIGSPLSAELSIGLGAQYQLHEPWSLKAEAGLQHFSNGATTMPNMGINVPQVVVGIIHRPQNAKERLDSMLLPRVQMGWGGMMTASVGIVDTYIEGAKPFPYGQMGFFATYRRNSLSKLLFGIEGFYNGSIERVARYTLKNDNRYENARVGLTIGHQLYLGRTSFVAELGRYIYKQDPLNTEMYQRLGLHYDLSQSHHVHISLKVHSFAAEAIEWGYAYTL